MVEAVQELNLDGVDLTQKESCGDGNFNCDDLTSQHLNIVLMLRKRLPDKIITYTYPASNDYPFRDIIRFAHPLLDTINVYRATEGIMDFLINELEVPPEKVRERLSNYS